MNQRTADKKLVQGIVRTVHLMSDEEQKLYGKKDLTWDQRTQKVVSLLNSPGTEGMNKILESIDAVLKRYEDFKNCWYLTKEYVHCARKLLEIRMRRKEELRSKIIYKKEYQDENIYLKSNKVEAGWEPGEELKSITTCLKEYGNTIVSYHDIEVFGEERVIKDLREATGMQHAELSTLEYEHTPLDVRIKEHIYPENDTRHHYATFWDITPIMPTALVELDN